MIILVCGGRNYADYETMMKALDSLLPSGVELVIHGDAKGADRMAKAWAHTRGLHYASVPALWDLFGNEAGPKRNCAMLALRPDIVVAFPGGAGTAHMKRTAEAASIPVMDVPK